MYHFDTTTTATTLYQNLENIVDRPINQPTNQTLTPFSGCPFADNMQACTVFHGPRGECGAGAMRLQHKDHLPNGPQWHDPAQDSRVCGWNLRPVPPGTRQAIDAGECAMLLWMAIQHVLGGHLFPQWVTSIRIMFVLLAGKERVPERLSHRGHLQ